MGRTYCASSTELCAYHEADGYADERYCSVALSATDGRHEPSPVRRAAAERIHAVQRMAADRLPPDLRAEADLAITRLDQVEAYCVTLGRADGLEEAQALHVLVLPDHGRAGVAWGADAEWTDIDETRGDAAAREAVARFLAGEMVQ